VVRPSPAFRVFDYEKEPVLGEFPDRFGRIREERWCDAEESFVPGLRGFEVTDAATGKEVYFREPNLT